MTGQQSAIQDILKCLPFINKCKYPFHPHITSIYILYKASFSVYSARAETGSDLCIDAHTDTKVFVS